MKCASAILRNIVAVVSVLCLGGLLFLQDGCARIVPPSGGPRDSLPPVLVSALPRDSTLHMPLTGLKITLNFDEFIQLDNPSQNFMPNPVMKTMPIVESNGRKTVTIRIKDTLEPNTTYSLDFGKSIKDVNEGNVFRNFTYLFSTGSVLDSGVLFGRVRVARTNKVDSTLLVILHRHDDDSAVAKETPRYVARLDSGGRFLFQHIATGVYSIFALKDVGDKKYHDKSELFAFYDHRITVTKQPAPSDSLLLYAYAEEGPRPKAGSGQNNTKKPTKKEEKERKLHVSVSLQGGKQDILSHLYITYDQPIRTSDSTQLQLTDTLYHPLPYVFINKDTSHKKFGIHYQWHEDSALVLIIGKTFATDTLGITLLKADTIRFKVQREAEYGSLTLRLHNFDLSKHPVLQFVQNDKIVDSMAVTGPLITRPLYHPGEYEIKVLYDTNQNGTWDPGSYFGIHRQPEIVVSPKTPKIKVRGNGWENEYDVVL